MKWAAKSDKKSIFRAQSVVKIAAESDVYKQCTFAVSAAKSE